MAEDAAVAEAPSDSVAPKASDGSKPAPKQLVKRTAKPSVEELKAKIRALDDAIAATKARQETIRKELDGRRRQGGDSESVDIRKQLQELRAQFNSVLVQRKSAREELDGATKAREALRLQVRSMKNKIEYTTVEKIDEQLRRMESQLHHTTMPLAEEKKVVDNMEKLRKSRSTVAQFSNQMEKLNGEDDCKLIMDRLKAFDDQLNGIKSKEETLRSKMSDLRAKDDAKNCDIPQLQQELTDGKVMIRETITTIHALRDEHRAKQEEWWAGEEAWRKQRQIDRERRDAEYAAMRAEKEVERKQRAKELAGDPFDTEVSMCEQLHGYLTRHQDSTKSQIVSQEEAQDVKPLDGMNIYTKKKVEDDNPFANLQKKSKKGRKADKFKASEPTDKKINHSFDLLEAFSRLKVEAPLTASKVPVAMEALEERKAYWMKRREEANAKGDNDGSEDGNNGDAPSPAATGTARQQPSARREPKAFDLGAAEPTPAEAAAGRAPAPSSADAPAIGSGGAWKTTSAAPPAEVAANGAADSSADADAGQANDSSEGIKLSLTPADDGSVHVELNVGQ